MDFMISESLITRLISLIIRLLTHTRPFESVRFPRGRRRWTHSLCGSTSHCGSSSCWRNGPLRCDHHRGHGNRTLRWICELSATFEIDRTRKWRTEKLVSETSIVSRVVPEVKLLVFTRHRSGFWRLMVVGEAGRLRWTRCGGQFHCRWGARLAWLLWFALQHSLTDLNHVTVYCFSHKSATAVP